MDKWKVDMTEIIVDCNIGPSWWFQATKHTTGLNKNPVNNKNGYNITPIVRQKEGLVVSFY